MSEKKETIEERYEYVKEHSRFYPEDVVFLLYDLMAEREKMKKRIDLLEEHCRLMADKIPQ